MVGLRYSPDENKLAGDTLLSSVKPASSSSPLTGFFTTAMVKRRYNFSSSTLHKWRAEGRFPAPVQIGPRAVRWRAEDLTAFEASLKSTGK